MADFNAVLPTIWRVEGADRFTDNPQDPGGATKFGISLRMLAAQDAVGPDHFKIADLDKDGDVDADDVRKMTPDVAAWFYRNQWWDRYGYGRFTLQDVADRVMVNAINIGPYYAHVHVQRSLRAAGTPVDEDGKLGPQTVAAVNDLNPERRNLFVGSLKAETACHYRSIVQSHPDLKTFLVGWLNRAYR